MDLILGYELLESYKRLPYKVWYALAEFVDNSIQSCRNHPDIAAIYKEDGETLTVSIDYDSSKANGFIRIEDNAFGMNGDVLTKALILGKRPDNDKGLSKYGMGLKTAAFWFGDQWEISTTEYGSETKYTLKVDLDEIIAAEKKFHADQAENGGDLQYKWKIDVTESPCDAHEHGTTITITKLHQRITPARANNCKMYLGSIYRKDIEKGTLNLIFQGDEVNYEKANLTSKLLKDEEGNDYYRSFTLDINGKTVEGWAAILRNGSRNLGGFALIQADRVIQGWPANYRPITLFGDQDGGSNTLTNQRLFGELKLDGFEVSHTKDNILFSDDDELKLDEKLQEELGDFKRIAAGFRLKNLDVKEEFDFKSAIDNVLGYVNRSEFKDTLFTKSVLPNDVIEKSNVEVMSRLSSISHEEMIVDIDGIEVKVIISSDSSVYDPYLIVQTKSDKNRLTIIINKNHTYWGELSSPGSIFDFIVSCIYDGLSEWKAYHIVGNIEPDTIKFIKDAFLRLPLNFK
jgi:hypothetical protein